MKRWIFVVVVAGAFVGGGSAWGAERPEKTIKEIKEEVARPQSRMEDFGWLYAQKNFLGSRSYIGALVERFGDDPKFLDFLVDVIENPEKRGGGKLLSEPVYLTLNALAARNLLREKRPGERNLTANWWFGCNLPVGGARGTLDPAGLARLEKAIWKAFSVVQCPKMPAGLTYLAMQGLDIKRSFYNEFYEQGQLLRQLSMLQVSDASRDAVMACLACDAEAFYWIREAGLRAVTALPMKERVQAAQMCASLLDVKDQEAGKRYEGKTRVRAPLPQDASDGRERGYSMHLLSKWMYCLKLLETLDASEVAKYQEKLEKLQAYLKTPDEPGMKVLPQEQELIGEIETQDARTVEKLLKMVKGK